MKYGLSVCCLFLSLVFSASLFAAEENYIETLNLKDSATDWNVAVSYFSTQNISLENQYLAFSLPLKIYTSILNYQTHTLSAEERAGYAAEIIDNARQTLLKEASDLRKSFDEFDFETVDSVALQTRQTKQWELLQKRETLDKKFLYLKEFSPAEMNIAEERNIVVLRESDSQELCAPVKDKWKQFATEKKADLLIFGRLEEMAGYIYYRIAAYSPILDKMVFEAE